MRSLSIVSVGAVVCLVACSGFTTHQECEDGATSPCETRCGPGTMTCADGSWGACQIDRTPECLPGDFESCELAADRPPGLRFCSDICEMGPCIPLCNPGDTTECDGQCGPGRMTCDNDGNWGECREFILPHCRPGEVEICNGDDGPGHWRCNDDCEFGPCDGSLECFPDDIASCGQCASQACEGDGEWGECQPFDGISCAPGDSRECQGPCGPGMQYCSGRCEWSNCFSVGDCIPGQRQVCPGFLYCGLAYRICGPSCYWLDCIEAF